MTESQVYQELIKHFHENRLAHAFLVETNDMDKSYLAILQFLKVINCPSDYKENCQECNLCHLIDNGNLPSLLVVEPDGNTIKKEQVMEIKKMFQTKPIFSKYNMYIIKNAELLNASSANTMLKFIEEPEENILAFFLTNNKENIIDTIKSRCQIILDYYDGENGKNIPLVWQTIAFNYLKECFMVQDEAILYNKTVLTPLVHDRKELLYLFQSLFYLLQKIYDIKLGIREPISEYAYFLEKDEKQIKKYQMLVLQILKEINFNVNISLILDRFVLEGSD